MKISEIGLMEMATAYIENGKLKKWRYDSINTNHMNAILNEKRYSQKTLTEEELVYVMSFDNVIVEGEQGVEFHRFSGSTYKYR